MSWTRRSAVRLVALACAAWLAACADRSAQSTSLSLVSVEVVAVEQGLNPPTATFRVVNNTDRVLAYQGDSAGHPDYRLGLQAEGKWVERAPELPATGHEVHRLEPGTGVTFEVRAPLPYLSMCVGVGTCDPIDDGLPDQVAWTWAWSRTVNFDQPQNPSGG